MKKFLMLSASILASVSICSCSMQSYVRSDKDICEAFYHNKEIFSSVTAEVLDLSDEPIVVSHTDYYAAIDNDDINGLYVSDLKGNYKSLDSNGIENFMKKTGVKGISVSHEYGNIVEFDMGAGKYYRGIYYSGDDRPLYIADPESSLSVAEGGWEIKNDDVNFYTSSLEDSFYYYRMNE